MRVDMPRFTLETQNPACLGRCDDSARMCLQINRSTVERLCPHSRDDAPSGDFAIVRTDHRIGEIDDLAARSQAAVCWALDKQMPCGR